MSAFMIMGYTFGRLLLVLVQEAVVLVLTFLTRSSAVVDMPPESVCTFLTSGFIGRIFQLAVIHQTAAVDSTLAVFSDICLPLSYLTASIRGIPSSYRVHIWYGKTRMAGLQSGKNRMTIDSVF